MLDAANGSRCVVVAHCHAVPWVLRLAAEHPDRVAGIVAIAPGIALAPGHGYATQAERRWAEEIDAPTGWRMRNRGFWQQEDGYRPWIMPPNGLGRRWAPVVMASDWMISTLSASPATGPSSAAGLRPAQSRRMLRVITPTAPGRR